MCALEPGRRCRCRVLLLDAAVCARPSVLVVLHDAAAKCVAACALVPLSALLALLQGVPAMVRPKKSGQGPVIEPGTGCVLLKGQKGASALPPTHLRPSALRA